MYLKAKIDAGAHYIVTQMFFDNAHYFEFVKRCRELGIEQPIIPGIKPLTKRYQLQSIPRMFYVDIPPELVKEVEKAKTDEAVREAGIAWSIAQSQELKKAGVPCIHYYTMGDAKTIQKISSAVF